MKIVASNHADTLRRRPWDETQDAHVVDTVTEELRAHFGAATDDMPAEILALAKRLDPSEAERVRAA